MGQQQVLLLVLVTIVVGLMTVVGIVLFEKSRDEGTSDVIRQDVMEAATIGQMYYKKHTMMGGGGNSFLNVTMNDIQLPDSNAISHFEISETDQSYFKITATPLLNEITPLTAVVYSDRIVWE